MIIPLAMAPVMINIFLDSRTAFITHTFITLIISLIVPDPYIFVLLQLIAGIAAIYSLTELTERVQIFRVALVVVACYCLVFFGYELITKSTFAMFNKRMYIHFLLNGVLLLFTYPLMLLYEKLFRFTSDVTLMELSNFNIKLLRQLSEAAPGTFQHSMQVANLAAEAARAIGANSLEVRTGALYHDIGKSSNPIIFTENQSGGKSPHDELEPQESAQIIIRHVTEGAAIAERNGLPKKIRDFITTHHGLSKTGYFYITYKNEHPGEEINEALFTYPGPKPTTREQGILMLADCVEAASHSIKEYTAANIEKKVDDIINPKLTDGELEMCPLTFQDIYTIKEIFKERLKAIYHTRISYPEEKK